jgi:hypothetical protein
MRELLSKNEMPQRLQGEMMDQAYRAIETAVASVRTNRNRKRALRAGLLAAAAGLAVLIAACALLPALGGAPRLALRAVLALVLLAAAVAPIVYLIVKREGLQAAARAIERTNPHLKNDLINALQLTAAAGKPGPAGAFSRDLLTLHLEQTAAAIPALDLNRAAPNEPLRRPALAVIGLLLIFILISLLAPGRGRLGLAALFTDPWALPREQTSAAVLPLTTGDFVLHYEFPAYAGIPPQTASNTNGDLAALKGTSVRIQTRVLEPLASAALVTSAGARYAMTIADKTALAAELVISESGTYTIEGLGPDGKRRAEPGSHRITADEDLAPTALITAPVGDEEVASEGVLAISYEAEDDFGLRQASLVYNRGGKENRIELKTVAEDGMKRLAENYDWSLSRMGFLPGDRVPYYIEVKDNDATSGGNVGRSDTRILEIFSARKEHRKLLARQDELLNRMIDHLAAHLDAIAADAKPGANPLESERALLAKGSEIVTFIEELHKDMEADDLSDPLVVDALFEMQNRYFNRLAERTKFIADNQALSGPQRQQLADLRQNYRADLENDVIFLDKLVKKQRVADLMSEADDLKKAQSDLADLMEQYKRTGDPALREKILDSLAQLQESWANLMARMAEMRKDMPEEFLNQDAFKGQTAGDLNSQMEKLRQALADGDMDAALSLADQFLNQMDKYMSSLEKDANDYSTQLTAEMAAKIDQLQNELDDLINRQKGVEDSVSELYQKALNRQDKTGKTGETGENSANPDLDAYNLDQEIQKFRDALSQAMNGFDRLQPLDPNGNPQPITPELGEQRRDLAAKFSKPNREALDMNDELKKGNLEGALQQSARIGKELEDLKAQANDFIAKNNAVTQPARHNYEADMENAQQIMKGIDGYLQNLKDQLNMSLSAAEQKALNDLSQFQKQLQQDTDRVKENYDDLQSQVSSLPQDGVKSLGEASGKMNDAAGKMQAGDAGRAQLPAQQARSALEKAKAGLDSAKEKMMKGGGSSGGGLSMGQPGGSGGGRGGRGDKEGADGSPEGNIKLPDENAYKVPEEFRQQLLKAMKEGSPDAYKNLNKDYYERLVR